MEITLSVKLVSEVGRIGILGECNMPESGKERFYTVFTRAETIEDVSEKDFEAACRTVFHWFATHKTQKYFTVESI